MSKVYEATRPQEETKEKVLLSIYEIFMMSFKNRLHKVWQMTANMWGGKLQCNETWNIPNEDKC